METTHTHTIRFIFDKKEEKKTNDKVNTLLLQGYQIGRDKKAGEKTLGIVDCTKVLYRETNK